MFLAALHFCAKSTVMIKNISIYFKIPSKNVFEELVSQTSYIHSDMLLICIIDFLLQLE